MRSLIAAFGVVALLAPLTGHTADAGVASGAYEDGLLIGFDPATQVVTGYFSQEMKLNVDFSCIFYLTGKLRGAAAAISTYDPDSPSDVIKGRLQAKAGKQIELGLESEPGGCQNIEDFADPKAPLQLGLQSAYPWMAIAVVKPDKAYFYDTPTSVTHRKGYVVQGNGVGVRAIKPGWLQVDFVSGKKVISGWIRQSDVYPAG